MNNQTQENKLWIGAIGVVLVLGVIGLFLYNSSTPHEAEEEPTTKPTEPCLPIHKQDKQAPQMPSSEDAFLEGAATLLLGLYGPLYLYAPNGFLKKISGKIVCIGLLIIGGMWLKVHWGNYHSSVVQGIGLLTSIGGSIATGYYLHSTAHDQATTARNLWKGSLLVLCLYSIPQYLYRITGFSLRISIKESIYLGFCWLLLQLQRKLNSAAQIWGQKSASSIIYCIQGALVIELIQNRGYFPLLDGWSPYTIALSLWGVLLGIYLEYKEHILRNKIATLPYKQLFMRGALGIGICTLAYLLYRLAISIRRWQQTSPTMQKVSHATHGFLAFWQQFSKIHIMCICVLALSTEAAVQNSRNPFSKRVVYYIIGYLALVLLLHRLMTQGYLPILDGWAASTILLWLWGGLLALYAAYKYTRLPNIIAQLPGWLLYRGSMYVGIYMVAYLTHKLTIILLSYAWMPSVLKKILQALKDLTAFFAQLTKETLIMLISLALASEWVMKRYQNDFKND